VSTGGQGQSFWTTLPGILTAIAGVITAVTGLLVVLNQVGLFESEKPTNGAPIAAISTSPPSSPPSATEGTAIAGEGDALTGTWRGLAGQADGKNRFNVRLEIATPCELRNPCGTISVSSTPCSGRATLWGVHSKTYEFYVDQFTAGSSSDCSPGAGDFFELLNDGTLRYTTDYSDVVGLLHKAS
jgi:hypothetical protein